MVIISYLRESRRITALARIPFPGRGFDGFVATRYDKLAANSPPLPGRNRLLLIYTWGLRLRHPGTRPLRREDGIMNRTSKAAVLAAMITALSGKAEASLWTLSNGGVWDIPAGKRVTWNPAIGAIGNMGAGVIFSVTAPPANVQAGAAAQAALGYTFWNALSAIPNVNINFVPGAAAKANSTTSWGALANSLLGSTNNAAVNFIPRNITLSNTLTVRSDGWNIYNPAGPAASQQFDTFSINVHEAGHVLGLNHPSSLLQIMAQTGAAVGAGGRWAAVEKVTPFAGQPLSLNAAGVPTNALPKGTPTYFEPRGTFGVGDAIGAITLYSAPISAITSVVTAVAHGVGHYLYTVFNNAAQGLVGGTHYASGYDERTFKIPVDPDVSTSNLLVSNPGYSITRRIKRYPRPER